MTTKSQKQNIVNLKELRENMETYIKRVGNGETITVYRRSTPLFKIAPTDEVSDEWETIVNFPKEIGGGMPLTELLQSMKKYGQKRKVS